MTSSRKADGAVFVETPEYVSEQCGIDRDTTLLKGAEGTRHLYADRYRPAFARESLTAPLFPPLRLSTTTISIGGRFGCVRLVGWLLCREGFDAYRMRCRCDQLAEPFAEACAKGSIYSHPGNGCYQLSLVKLNRIHCGHPLSIH
ncbi:hypothetical protein PH562_26890 [Rhizobium sp. CNPSo 4062]|uniref:hypothetical protein n=1 Tax=Rhizobium sp. CNPSo 4062 TaxID=3021410 RepID=UPI002550C0C9|nr:hypothetical protein [Rhizobium sp. CNPSo 4062]MDK4705901.1 hypothetical protein [Rhizobium sp. CNPSo 4062]